ncbi:MAG: hypothetical protein K6E63_10525 [Lachnospiraceae bacterium]|nr:hypothetical protein [Lachnospiraceae bacterium]
MNEFYINEEVGEKAVRDGIIEDCDVNVNFDFDDFLRPSIVGLSKASTTAAVRSQGGLNV